MIGCVLILAGAAAGLAAGYWFWGGRPNWYAVRAVEKLPTGRQNDLVIYGYRLIINTQRYLGPDAADAAMRFAGNNLACGNGHLRAGLQPFAAPFVSTYTTYPMMVDDRVITVGERINGCMTRSMNGRALPVDGHEMAAMLAYIEFLGQGTPAGIRVAGMGLRPVSQPDRQPDPGRGQSVYGAMGKVPWRRRARPSAQCSASRRIRGAASVGRRLVQFSRRHEPADDRERLCARQHALWCR